jgi:hypothetical protein
LAGRKILYGVRVQVPTVRSRVHAPAAPYETGDLRRPWVTIVLLSSRALILLMFAVGFVGMAAAAGSMLLLLMMMIILSSLAREGVTTTELTGRGGAATDHRPGFAGRGIGATIANDDNTAPPTKNNIRQLSIIDPFRDPRTVETRRGSPIRNTNTPASSSLQGQHHHHPEHLEINPILHIEPTSTMMIRPYTINNAILTLKAFKHLLFFFVYDASSDTFVIVHNAGECTGGCRRIHVIAPILSYALRRNFPERFHPRAETKMTKQQQQQQQQQQEQQQQYQGKPDDFVAMISCGDNPSVKQQCLHFSETNNYCDSVEFAPILHFGSIFVNTIYLPSAVAMPPPVMPHLPCFHEWQTAATTTLSESGQEVEDQEEVVCDALQPPVYGSVINENDYWDRLVPQIVWRGTDFGFLDYNLLPGMRAPDPQSDIPWRGRKFTNEYEKKRYAIESLLGMGSESLLPRWRGVLMTSLAELERSEILASFGAGVSKKDSDRPRQEDLPRLLPWLDIKFSHVAAGGKKRSADDDEQYLMFRDLGITVSGDIMSTSEQANYRYHIDLGGGSGTTWTGTLQKLSMPGVLFHHVTPTKDWYYGLLVPWEHYIPINMDLNDLREKYEWAESHPNEARQISENGTRFVRWMSSKEGLGQLYDNYLVAPLRNIINAYNFPSSPMQYEEGRSVLDIINGMENNNLRIVAECSGRDTKKCKRLG